ncbi:SpoIIE family protein phosphatase [Streptomyces sp. NBC_01498]|uniref:SpoIIE family protein phosphatase n=1 Tax=Streptomyces sp. NBC_01498 TaxID=2975870 RepID=UPI002E7BE0DB|nr:SpoIIE family protein phosphatase [Streptomyces sp. NBC_01498]WTL28551.1 SpoIIE family protein phosphatase [Streptomyces sp. NBC_01498]
MMARESSFTIDGGGNVSEWHDAAHNYPDITSRDIVGVPAGVALDRLLGRLTDANGSPGPAALLLSACRDRAETVVSLRGTAPSLHAAQVEAAFDSSAFERSTAGLEVYDTDLSVLRANAAALAMRGRPAARVLRHRVGNLGSRVPLAPFLRKVLDGDETAAQGRIDGHDGHGGSRVFAVTAFQLRDEREVIGAGAVIHDVTEQDRAERAARLLRRAHQEIGTRLDAPRTARELATVATRDFADAVSVDLVDAVLHGGEAPLPPVGTDVVLRRAAFEAPGGLRATHAVGEMSYYASATPYSQVFTDLTPRLLDPTTSPSDWLMHDAARAGALRDAGIHSMIVAPLSSHGRVLGLVGFYRGPRHPVPFEEADVSLAEQVSARASVHIENARTYAREHTMAVTLRRNLLPRTFPDLSAVTTAHFCAPDVQDKVWFDVIALSGARVGLAIGEVPQQGLDAAVATGQYRTALDTLAALDLPPDELLAHLDDATGQFLSRHGGPPGANAPPAEDSPRCLYAVYDPVTGELSAASAGWPAPLLTTPDGEVAPVDLPIGPPLGRGASYELARRTVPPESVLTLCSHAFPDTGIDLEERVALLRRSAAEVGRDPKALCDSVVQGLLTRGSGEGAAMLAALTHRLPEDSVATWAGDQDPGVVAASRDRAGRQLEDWGLAAQVFTTEMVVSELVTNVIRHAGGNPLVRLIRDRALTVEVSDNTTTSPHLRHARAQDENGRGLMIIAALARRWGTRYTPSGKTIWVEQDLD